MKYKIYYTAHEGRRNCNGHTTTTGNVFIVDLIYKEGASRSELVNIGEYKHHSGGADIALAILTVAQAHGIDTNGGYYGKYHDVIELEEIY